MTDDASTSMRDRVLGDIKLWESSWGFSAESGTSQEYWIALFEVQLIHPLLILISGQHSSCRDSLASLRCVVSAGESRSQRLDSLGLLQL